jgi:hypothetical protein
MFAKIRTTILVASLTVLGAATYADAASVTQGREVAAPPWSFACTTDHGHSNCGEPIWVYVNAR